MALRVLGISAFYHDSAAALVTDGRVVAAAQEERFTRVKHDSGYPERTIAYCLEAAGVASARELDAVVFYEKPVSKFARILEAHLAAAPAGFPSFLKAMPLWLKSKLWMEHDLTARLGVERVLFSEHHLSHAAAAFFPSPFADAAVLTVDGAGEWATTAIGEGDGNRLGLLEELRFPHSLGLLYSAFTGYCGFKVNSGEYKLMGLAPYGEPVYAARIRDELVDLRPDGSFRLNMRYFGYLAGLTMTNRRFSRLFGMAPRKPETPFTKEHMDLAASIQLVTEECMLGLARRARDLTGRKNLCLAGGVALNCVANGRLLREGPFDDIWIQPASGDAGGALGAALAWYHAQAGVKPRRPSGKDGMSAALLGPSFSAATATRLNGEQAWRGETYRGLSVTDVCDRFGVRWSRVKDPARAAAGLLAKGKIVGWFQGRMEFGPRALGARSILADPRDRAMQQRLNLSIKFRESFRPFAPSVLAEDAARHFVDGAHSSPYMLLVTQVKGRRNTAATTSAEGFAKLSIARGTLPAITHVDWSARLHTVDKAANPVFHRLLTEFKRLTGCPALVNTSFNVRGEPIVCAPEDAVRCFLGTHMDALLIEDILLLKDEQDPALARPFEEYHLGWTPD